MSTWGAVIQLVAGLIGLYNIWNSRRNGEQWKEEQNEKPCKVLVSSLSKGKIVRERFAGVISESAT